MRTPELFNFPLLHTCIPEQKTRCNMCCLWGLRSWICVFVVKLSKLHSTEWVRLKSTKIGALNSCNKLEIVPSLKITCSVVVMLEHCSTRGLHLCIMAASATVIYTFNSMVSNIFMYLYVFEWLIAMVSHGPLWLPNFYMLFYYLKKSCLIGLRMSVCSFIIWKKPPATFDE